MKTKLQVLASITALIAFTQLSKAQVVSSGNSNDGSNSMLNVSVADNVKITDNSQSLLAVSSYHHGSSSSGDNAFSGNLINVGIGFLSGEGKLYNGSGYNTTVAPAFELSYERAITSNIGVGLNISYQTAKSTYDGSGYNIGPPPTYALTPYNYTDTYKLSLLQFCVRGAYHFSAGSNFDPYVGIGIGYCTISDAYSSTQTGATSSSSSLTGVEFGGFAGARYFFSGHVGAWLEIQYADASFKVGSGGSSGTSVTVNINPCTVFNLGIAFKF